MSRHELNGQSLEVVKSLVIFVTKKELERVQSTMFQQECDGLCLGIYY